MIVGLKKADNEEAFLITPPKKLYAVLLRPSLSFLSKNLFFLPCQREMCAWQPLPVKF